MKCGHSSLALSIIVALILLIIGFIFIFNKQSSSESDVQVVQRQLKGFALLILAPIVGLAIVMVFEI